MKSVYLKKKKAFRFVCSLCRVRDICEALPLLHSPHPGVVLCVVLLLLHILHVYVRLQGQCANPYPLLHCIKMNMC